MNESGWEREIDRERDEKGNKTEWIIRKRKKNREKKSKKTITKDKEEIV